MPIYDHTFYREGEDGEETPVLVEFSMSPRVPARTYGPPEDCSPAEGGEVEIRRCKTDANGWAEPFTDIEAAAWTDWLEENYEPVDYDPND